MKRLAAIKVLAATVAGEEAFAQRFQREVETLAHLHHPNIVMAFDAGECHAGPFLVMEFVEGRDLASEVREGGPLSLIDAVSCVLQAARGLEYAHAQGLVHRDVKPANLLRDTTGVVKVADLGVARINTPLYAEQERSLTQAGGVLGTVDYMAPEQALDSTMIDGRADIYSLGCTLYYLLTGRPPYSGTSIMSLMVQHRETPPPLLLHARPDVPDFLNAIYLHMVAKKVEHRHPNMAAVIAEFEEARPQILSLEGSALRPQAIFASEITLNANSPQQKTAQTPRLEPGHALRIGKAPTPTSLSDAPTRAFVRPTPMPKPVETPRPTSAQAAVETGQPKNAPRIDRRTAIGVAGLAALLMAGSWFGWQMWHGASNVRQPAPTNSQPIEPPSPTPDAIVSGGGSTFINPLMTHWAGIYEKRHGVRIEYRSVGSGLGITGLLHGFIVLVAAMPP